MDRLLNRFLKVFFKKRYNKLIEEIDTYSVEYCEEENYVFKGIDLVILKSMFLHEDFIYELSRNTAKNLLAKNINKFSNKLIAKLYLRFLGRIIYAIEEENYTEALIMEIIKAENLYKKKCLKKGEYSDYFNYAKRKIPLKDVIPKNFFITNKQYINEILKEHIEYFYLIKGPYKKSFFEHIEEYGGLDLNKDIINRMELCKQSYAVQEYILANLLKRGLRNDDRLAEYFLDNTSIYPPYLLMETLNGYNINYLKLSNFDELYFTEIQFSQVVSKCPNVYFKKKELYKSSNAMETNVEEILEAYSTQKDGVIEWNISEKQLDLITSEIYDNLTLKNSCDMYVNKIKEYSINTIKNLMLLSPDIYFAGHFDDKYSKEFVNFMYNLPVHKFSGKKRDFSKELHEIFNESFLTDMFDETLTKNDLKLIIDGDIKDIFVKFAAEFLSEEHDKPTRMSNAKYMIKLIKMCPRLLSFKSIISKLSETEIESIAKYDIDAYKYILKNTDAIKVPNIESILVNSIRFKEKNIKYIDKKYFNPALIDNLINTNKNTIKYILISMEAIKDIDYDFLNDILIKEYDRAKASSSENEDFYLRYLSDEYIVKLLVFNELKLSKIKDKKALKKVRKIYSSLDKELFL